MSESIIHTYFGLSDIVSAIAWLLLLSAIVYMKSLKLETKRLARIYVANFAFKIFFCLVFVFTYILLFNGGDTTAYWNGAECIQNLMLDSPMKALEHFFTTPERANYHTFFNESTGYPPIWIYREPESYFVCKLTALVGLLCFKSYLAVSLIFAFFLAEINWKIYRIVLKINVFQEKYIHLAVLFIPSVSFWCGGVSKDTIILISFFHLFYLLYSMIYLEKGRSIIHWIGLFFFFFIIYHTRNFMLMPIVVPLLIAFFVSTLRKYKIAPILQIPINIGLLTIIAGISILYLSSERGANLIASNGFIKEAIVVQQDFKHNIYYGKNQYSIGEIDNTPLGILKSIPISVFSGIYQPLPWNGLSFNLLINAIESLVFLVLTAKIILTGKLFRWIQIIRNNDLLLFFIIFVFIIAFMAGFTSIIYGVLVRIRAPLLPLFASLLLIKLTTKVKPNNELDSPTDNIISVDI